MRPLMCTESCESAAGRWATVAGHRLMWLDTSRAASPASISGTWMMASRVACC